MAQCGENRQDAPVHQAARRPVWVCTNSAGEIDAISPGAADFFGGGARGRNLFSFFPFQASGMSFDMAVALVGWPGRSTAILELSARQSFLVEYDVCVSPTTDLRRLRWTFTVLGEGEAGRWH
jgi:hypothetical protein